MGLSYPHIPPIPLGVGREAALCGLCFFLTVVKMTIAELTNKVEYLTDAAGQRRAVVLDLAVWEELLQLLEKLDEQQWDEAFANSQDQLAQLADEALAEYRQGNTQELTPEML